MDDAAIGAFEYVLYPGRRSGWGPFNGQRSRQELFNSLVARFAPVAIIETGTFVGTTTEFMAATGLPIYSVESDPRSYGFARARFWRSHNVHLLREDSRTALRNLFQGRLRGVANRSLFVYLDAHWNNNLPLAE